MKLQTIERGLKDFIFGPAASNRPAASRSASRRSPTVQPRNFDGFAMSSGSRLFADWTVNNVTSDGYLRTQLVSMRTRSRELSRNEDYMKSFLGACRNNIAGPNGSLLRMDITNPDGSADDPANDAIEAAWREFSKPWSMSMDGTKVPHFCASGRHSRAQFEQLCVSTAARDGEGLIRLVRNFANPFRFTVQPINADYLDETKNEILPDGGNIRLGVQTNRWGQTTHYWLRKYNPADLFNARGNFASEPVPATDIIHYFLPDDFELSRGYPWAHAAATRLRMLGGYEEAALEAARSAACKHEVWERPMDSNGEFQGDAVDVEGNPLQDTEPGMREIAPVGWKLNNIDPAYPHTEHKGFINATLMGVASGLHVSAMTLTGDLTQANYSSMRAGLLPERDQWTLLQNVLLIAQIDVPIFFEWLRMSLLSGAIKLPNGKPLPATGFEKFAKPCFLGRRWPWVDPMKDQQAAELSLKLKTGTRTDIVSQQGGDLEDVFRTLKHEDELATKTGVELPDLSGSSAPVEGVDSEASDSEELSAEMNTYGIGVRAGALTPTVEDENHFRTRAGLPPVTAAAKAAWKKDGDVRRPITLIPPEGAKPAGGFGQPAKPDPTEAEPVEE